MTAGIADAAMEGMHERQSATQPPEPVHASAPPNAEASEAEAVAVATVDEADAASGLDTNGGDVERSD